MPILSAKHKYLFLMAPGTASSAVSKGVLIPSLDGTYFPAEPILDHAGFIVVDHWHATVSELRRSGLLSAEDLNDLFKFTTVRNPFDALVTKYVRLRTRWINETGALDARLHRLHGKAKEVQLALECDTFSEWLKRRFLVHGIRSRVRHPFNRYARHRNLYGSYIKDADFVMRFEHLQSDFNEVTKRLGLSERFEIPKRNVTKDRDSDYRVYYTPKARKIVEAVFAPDLERFGYEF